MSPRAWTPPMPVDEAWLAQVAEPALDPGLPIVDPHHHLWDRPGSRYMLADLRADLESGHNVVATVFVECLSMYRADGPEALRPVGETEFANGMAAQAASGGFGPARVCAGIVGFADLTLGAAVDEVLEAHLSRAPDRFRGIRHAAGRDPSPEVRNSHTRPPAGLMRDAAYREGVARLAAFGLSFEAWLYHPQLDDLIDLARACPGVLIVLDHFGGPLGIGPYAGRRAEVFEAWRPKISALAECPNVTAKLGGLAMPINGYGWNKRARPPGSEELAAAQRDWHLHVIDRFGPDRCMFESNFPVDKVSCGYGVLWNAFKRIAAGFSDEEKRALFHDAAARVYRLDAASPSRHSARREP